MRILETSELRVLVDNWRNRRDFKLPDLGGNLLVPEEGENPQYVDFQNFGLREPRNWTCASLDRGVGNFHFGQSRPGRSSRYLYQSVPGIAANGKRNMERRWDLISSALRERGLDRKNLELPLPVPALHVAVLASLDSDGWNDFRAELNGSGVGFEVTGYDVRVQGELLRPTMLQGLTYFADRAADFDALFNQ